MLQLNDETVRCISHGKSGSVAKTMVLLNVTQKLPVCSLFTSQYNSIQWGISIYNIIYAYSLTGIFKNGLSVTLMYQ